MAKKLVIELSEEATKKYLELTAANNKASMEKDIEVSGYTIMINNYIFEKSAELQLGSDELDLGDVSIELKDI